MVNLTLLIKNYKLFGQNYFKNITSSLLDGGRNVPANNEYFGLPNQLDFRVTYDPSEKSFFLQCKTLPHIYLVSTDAETLVRDFNQVIYETCDVPRHAVQKLGIKYKFDPDFLDQLMKVSEGRGIETLQSTATRPALA